MWALIENNAVDRVIRTPQNITVNGVQYPRSIFTRWSKAELAAIGIKPYREVLPDSSYCWIGEPSMQIGDEVVVTYACTPRDLDTLKAGMKAQVKSQAASKLAETDWMVIRAAEGGTAVAEDVTTYRAAVRTASNTMETEIDALADMDAVKAYEYAWPVDPLAPVVEEEVSE
jgi:membrane-bound inhibitor of C-type lysozyme